MASCVPLLAPQVVEACTTGNAARLRQLIDAGEVFDTEAYLKWHRAFRKDLHIPDCKDTVILRQLIRLAAIHKHKSIVDWLLCFANAQSDRAAKAIELGSPEALQYLIELDPSLTWKVRYHYQTYLYVSLPLPEWKAIQAVDILLKHGTNPNFPEHFMKAAIKTGNPRLVALVDAFGGLPNKIELIASAAGTGSTELVQYLLDCQADVNYVFDQGMGTPLHHAVRNEDLAMLTLLLDKGADTTLKTANGKLALDFAHEIEDSNTRNKFIELLSVV